MPDTDQQPQQQRQLSPDALNALYRDLGAQTHTIYELQAQIAQRDDLLRRCVAEHGPKTAPAPGEDATAGEPTPITSGAMKGTG